jgi:PAS domain S-box-containing protein
MNVRQTTHILLIEDNPGDAQLVKIHMKEAAFKYELFVADTFYEALEILNKQEVDIVLLDLSLTDSQGFKTIDKFKENAPEIPFIVLTGVNNEIVGNQAVKAGAQDFLVKGQFNGKLLGRAIRYALQRHKEFQKLEESKRELTNNERRFVKAQQMAGFGDWQMDLLSSEMIWTEEIYSIFGLKQGNVSTCLSDYISYVSYEDREIVEDFFEKALKNGKVEKIEHRIVVDGKSKKWVAVTAQVTYDVTQQMILIGSVQDITEIKQKEELIMERNINEQTTEVKEKVLEEMSFLIRTPLSSLVNLMYLIEPTIVGPHQRRLVDEMIASVDELSWNIDKLLNFSTLVSQNLAPVNKSIVPKTFFDSVSKITKIKADNAKVKLELNVFDNLPEKIVADSSKITQIIYNLVDHAIRYSPIAGKITLEVGINNSEKQGELYIKMAYSGKSLTIVQIRELMHEDKILAVLKSELADHDKEKLVLPIVGKLVKVLAGNFNIANKGSDTTIFEVNIPVTIEQKVVLDASAPSSKLKILLVEDHKVNQYATKQLLLKWSPFVTVDIAEEGSIAVQKVQAFGYDLILMDLHMPKGMNGFDATVRIREKTSVPIIALTAAATTIQEVERCFKIGMNDYISKPFKPDELFAKIKIAMTSPALVAENAEIVLEC